MDNKKLKYKISLSIFLLIQLYCFLIVLKGPFLGIEITQFDKERWHISFIKENSWAAFKNLEISTEIVEVEGVELPAKKDSKLMVNQASQITILDKGKAKNLEVNYDGMENQFIKHFIFPLIFALLTLTFSIYLLRKNLNNRKNYLIFHLLCSSSAYTSAGAAGRGDYFSNIVVSITLFLSIVYLIFYCNQFLKTMSNKFRRKLKISILIMVLLLITINIIRFLHKEILYVQIVFELLIILSLLVVIIFNMFIARKNKVYYVKLLLSIFLCGIGPFILFYSIPILLGYKAVLSADIAALFLLIIPICLIYLELSEHLVSRQYALDRMFSHLKIALPFSLLITVPLMWVTKENSFSIFILYLLVIFLGLIIVLYAKEWIELRNDRYIYTSEYYTLSNFYQFIKSSVKISNMNHLIERIRKELSLILNLEIEDITIIKMDKEDFGDYIHLSNIQEASPNLIYKTSKGGFIILHEDTENKLLALIQIEDNLFPSGALKILELFLYYVQNMLDNSIKIEEMIRMLENVDDTYSPRWYGKIWVHSSERERKRLSIEIHDTVLQDLIHISRQLEALDINHHIKKENLLYLREEVLDIIENTRDICENLYPPMIERFGLNHSLDELIKKNKIRFDALIKENFENIGEVPLQQATIIYRIIQELLSNANKHSHAKTIQINLKSTNSKIYIEYFDDGVGFSPEFRFGKVNTLGLLGIRERIKYYDGNLNITSNVSHSVQISIIMNRGDDFENNDFR